MLTGFEGYVLALRFFWLLRNPGCVRFSGCTEIFWLH